MRMIFPAVLAILGGLCGLLINKLISSSTLAPQASAIAGVIGAFAGLLIRDYADIHLGNDLIATLIAALLGASLLSLIANLALGKR